MMKYLVASNKPPCGNRMSANLARQETRAAAARAMHNDDRIANRPGCVFDRRA